jgi:hypothetical protein
LQRLCSRKGLTARVCAKAPPEKDTTALMADDSDETVNALIYDGRTDSCREIVQVFVDVLVSNNGMVDGNRWCEVGGSIE